MNPSLRIDVDAPGGHTSALTVTGELDLTTAPELLRAVEGLGTGSRTVILDMTGVAFCDSSGLNALLRLRRHMDDKGGHVVLVEPPPQMMRLLGITGVAGIFTLYGSLAEAWRAHPADGPPPGA